MSLRQEAVAALTGSAMLARGDTSGYDRFDASVGGFLRSFLAVLLAWLLYVGWWAFDQWAGVPEASAPLPFVYELASFGTSLVAVPVILFIAIWALGRGEHYLLYITAGNWAGSVMMAAALMPMPVASVEMAWLDNRAEPWLTDPWTLVFLGTLIAVSSVIAAAIYFSWFIARTALRIGGVAAAGLIAFAAALDVAIDVGLAALFGVL